MGSIVMDALMLRDILTEYEFVPRLKGYGFHASAYVVVKHVKTGRILSGARDHEHGRAPHVKFDTANEAIEYVKENYDEVKGFFEAGKVK